MASTNSSGIFTGSSTYSSDFQQIIDRSVAIASLPLSQLNNQKNALTAQSSELSTLASKFSALHNAIDALSSAAGAGSFVASLSDTSVARANVGDTAFTGEVSLEVVSLGAHTNTLSLDALPKVTDPFTENVSVAPNFTLTVGGQTYTVIPASGTLSALAQSINNSGAGVRATIINLGSGTTPDYRLSIQSANFADVAIQLNDGGQDLLSTLSPGSPVTYRINGHPATPIQSDSRNVTLSPGLTADLLDTGTTNITVSRSTNAISNAISTFVGAYNAAVSELDANRGSAGGALTGQSLISTLSQALRQLTHYSGSGSVRSLSDLGLAFTKEGQLTFDSSALAGNPDVSSVLSFLGTSGGSGFLKTAGDLLNSIDTGDNSLLPSAISSVSGQITAQNAKIDSTQARIDFLRESLTTKITAADAVIAQLQQQVIFFTGLFDAFNKSNNNK